MDYAQLAPSTDPRDLAERDHWELKGRRAEQFLKERCFLRLCFNHYQDQDLSIPLPDILRRSHGKPYFKDDPAYFNLSNSGNAALLLFSRQQPVGLDLELIKPRRNLQALARKVLSPAEWRKFEHLGSAQPEQGGQAQLSYFLQRWTWRECLLKASGIALAGLSTVTGGSDSDPDVLLSSHNQSGVLYSYHFADLGYAPGFFTVFPGTGAGELCCLRISNDNDTVLFQTEGSGVAARFNFQQQILSPCARAEVNQG